MGVLPLAVATASASFFVTGVALAFRRRALASAALLAAGGLAGTASAVLLAGGRHDAALVTANLAGTLLLPLALALFPDARWRRTPDLIAVLVLLGCGIAATAYHRTDTTSLMGIVEVTLLVAHTWWRFETSDDVIRRAILWMSLGFVGSVLLYFFVAFSSEGSNDHALVKGGLALFAMVGPSMYVGATLPDLVDVRGVVVTGVVTTVALVTVMSVFVLELSLLDALGGTELNSGALAVLAALAATTFQPTRVLLRGVVDQLLFGERPDPLGAASAVADRMGDDPVLALRAIREALVIPYASLEIDGTEVASSGTATTHTKTLDLEGVGRLTVGLRPGDLAFSPGDEQVLRLTVPLLAQTLRARALAEEVVESRGRSIAAIEEERRRLRRDLHDGLGPRLSGVAFTSDAARNLVRSDPAAAEEMLRQLRADTVTAIEEIRGMVYAMRPPALDELGLVPALRQQARGLRDREGQPVSVAISADELADLPAAVEVAAYRIVTEALANIARHSTSRTATVRLGRTDDALRLEVTDTGASGAWRPGVGLSSMRERATELGGTLMAGPGPDGGRVEAMLPI